MTDLAALSDRLARAGCVAAEEEASELAGAASSPDELAAFAARREQGEPIAWITGGIVFCGRRVIVEPGVYVPRLQSEALALRAATLLPPNGTGADLCTGAGAIALHLAAERPGALVVGIDADERALACARSNGVLTLLADSTALPLAPATVDVVTAVAPYVPTAELAYLPADVLRFEPRLALDGGADGLGVVRGIVTEATRVLRPGGALLLEIGGDQDQILVPLLARLGCSGVSTWTDDEGDLRGVEAIRGLVA